MKNVPNCHDKEKKPCKMVLKRPNFLVLDVKYEADMICT